MLERLAKKGMIQLLVIDEAHFIRQSGRHFRPEFKSAARFMGRLLTLMPRRVPFLLLSATVVRADVEDCIELLGCRPPRVLHGALDRRTIKFSVFVTGCATASLKKSARKNYEKRPTAQQIWYTPSRTKAESSLREMGDSLLEENRRKTRDQIPCARHLLVPTES